MKRYNLTVEFAESEGMLYLIVGKILWELPEELQEYFRIKIREDAEK